MRPVKVPEVLSVMNNTILLWIHMPGGPWFHLYGEDPDTADILEFFLDEPFEFNRLF